MSNEEIENKLKDVGDDIISEPRIKVKPTIAIEDIPEEMRGHSLTAADLKRITAEIEANVRIALAESEYNGRTQMLPKSKVPIVTDFSTLTQDDIYRDDISIEAKPFMAGDPIRVRLKDSNYEARWVSLNSQRLGYMKSIGFSYVCNEDLADSLQMEVSNDASSHFVINDVVLMKIQKARYYPALKAAQARGVSAVNSTRASARGQSLATDFMARNAGADFQEATESGQMSFYNPGAK